MEQRMSEEPPLTISLVEAGRKYFGLSRGASYQAAERGELPTIRIGRRIRVPVRALEAMLDAVKPNGKGGEQ
jgi:excisionase family DNA binding protein